MIGEGYWGGGGGGGGGGEGRRRDVRYKKGRGGKEEVVCYWGEKCVDML